MNLIFIINVNAILVLALSTQSTVDINICLQDDVLVVEEDACVVENHPLVPPSSELTSDVGVLCLS